MSTERRRRAAATLIRRGVAVIPVPAGEKNPGRPGWEVLRITEEEMPDYWTNGQNVGLLCCVAYKIQTAPSYTFAPYPLVVTSRS